MKRIARTLTKYLTLIKAICYKNRFLNIFIVLVSYATGRKKVSGLPPFLQIEPTNRCNLNCKLCITGRGGLQRSKRDISFEEFVKIINQLEGSIIYLLLYNLGEPLLNTQIYEMIRYAKKKRIFVKLSTSGYFNDRKHVDNIISCGLDELVISLDCVTPQAYLKYKNSPSFETVIKNIELIIEKRGKRPRPFVDIQLLLLRDNEKEISRFKSLVRSLKVDRGLIKKIRVNFPGIEPDVSFLPEDDKYIRKSYQSSYKRERCFRPWISAVILSDNSIVPCCFDMHGKHNFGNITSQDFWQIWNNTEYMLFRKQVLADINQISLCRQCSLGNFFNNFIK